MNRATARVKVHPRGTELQAFMGDTLLDAALENGIEIEHECGGNCACTTCQVIVECGTEHLSTMQEVEDDRLSTADIRMAGSRLSCQAILIGGDVEIRLIGTG